MRKFGLVWAASYLALVFGGAVGVRSAGAAVTLVNGNLEASPTASGWSLSESVTGASGVTVESAEFRNEFADRLLGTSDEYGFWLKSFAGNTGWTVTGQNKQVNAALSQTRPATPGESYTFSGYFRWEENYSGKGTQVYVNEFSDTTAPSPTQTKFEVAFLDGVGAVIGSPTSLDLRTVQSEFDLWEQHAVTAVAPVGAASVRVTAAATDMVFNYGYFSSGGQQSAFVDDLSLRAASAPSTELLTNGGLGRAVVVPGWTLTTITTEADKSAVSYIPFAAHDGGRGLWLKPYSGGDALLTQTVPIVAGEGYTFSTWSKWEGGYSGGVTTLDPSSPLGSVPSPTQTLLEMAYLDGAGDVIGLPLTLDLRTVQSNDNVWRQQYLTGMAPIGAMSVRLSAKALNMVNNFDAGGALGNQSAFFDDFALTMVPEVGAAALVGPIAAGGAAVACVIRRRRSRREV